MFYTADPADLNPENLDHFHSLIFYNNQPTMSQDQLNALLGFVENGGGLVVLHSASAAFQNSEEYIRLVGGAFKSHGSGEFSATRVMPQHPAIQGVPAFASWDETYVHTKHNPVNRTVLEVRREGEHEEPWTWVRTYGDGRVFYTASGHDARTWSTEGFQELVVRGVRWSAGDWGLTAVPDEPMQATAPLDVPLPTYVVDAPWNTLGPPVREAKVAITPEESIELTTLLPEFSMEVFVTDPMIRRIIDFTWDERGRMWAVETNDYPNVLLPEGTPGGDRILIIEDTDNDNRADNVKVFAEGFNLATSVVLIDGGAVVAKAPHFYFLRDTNGDDVADTKEPIMTGWPRNDTHGTPSNFRYNLDNQIRRSPRGFSTARCCSSPRSYR
jgi:type 1 glutamine amidotransferase